MSRDEEMNDPIAAGQHGRPGEPMDMSKQESSVEGSASAPRFAVFIDADGSASIDGVPVQAAGGQSVDEAVLDTLHQHARERNSPVVAAISDPAADEVTFVEVAPDGSSRLVEPLIEPSSALPSETYGQDSEPSKPGFSDAPEAPDAPHIPDADGAAGAAPSVNGAPFEAVLDGIPDDFDGPEGLDHPGDAHDASRDADDPHLGPDHDPDADLDTDLRASRFSMARPSLPRPPLPSLSLPRRSKGPSGRTARQSDDEYRSSGLLHRPLVVGPVALGVAVLVIVPLVILGGGSDGDGGQNKAAGTSDKLNKSPEHDRPKTSPTVFVSPSLVPPSFSASPTAKPKPKDGATTTVRPSEATATVTSKPAPNSAAKAVNRLARNDPGRHICYRAFVSGQGWQKPVCDGAVAGTTGRNRAIKALNIAVSGAGGVGANAFVHKAGSTDGKGGWMPHWTANTDDGKNIYIGSSKKGAPDMLGYAINIGRGGQICHIDRVHDAGWGKKGCAKPRPKYTFGGTLDNDLWLEAVRFTV